jgi:phospholipase C
MTKILAVSFAMFQMSTAFAVDCSRQAGSLPNPSAPIGVANAAIPVDHIVVIMQENQSFDRYFGKLNAEKFYGKQIEGLPKEASNPDQQGNPVRVYHEDTLCTKDVVHQWNPMHKAWNNGKCDGFARPGANRVMSFYDESDLPYYYALANEFAVADHYFCSVLSQTYPNRFYLYAGTSFGHVQNDWLDSYTQRTIFDELESRGISWKYYTSRENYLRMFKSLRKLAPKHFAPIKEYKEDLDGQSLPAVAFLESSESKGEDEHPDNNVQIGQAWVADKIQALMKSPYWPKSALFLTYDENGGFYDHVAPPEACVPDDIAPRLKHSHLPGGFDRYGFRVPLTVISPYAKHHYVSHNVYDHTSILKFIETKFNLPALTRRDANADGLLDLFDFSSPRQKLPRLPGGEPDQQRSCDNKERASNPSAPPEL